MTTRKKKLFFQFQFESPQKSDEASRVGCSSRETSRPSGEKNTSHVQKADLVSVARGNLVGFSGHCMNLLALFE